jgi:hypothetical protein
MTPESHEPTAEFRSRLEWQVQTALRRGSRFAEPAGGGGLRRLRVAAMVAIALAAGGAAGVASGRVQDAKQRDQLVEAAKSEESLAALRLDLARTEFQETRKKFEIGVVGRETLLEAERQMKAMEAALARIKLNIEEIIATSAPPRDDLDAPLAGQRDFVRDRLRLELDRAQQALAAAEQTLSQAAARVEIGAASRLAEIHAKEELAAALAQMKLLKSKLELRQQLVTGAIETKQLLQTIRRMELETTRDQAMQELAGARARLQELQRRVEAGTADQLELKRAEVELLERELKLKHLAQELEKLRAIRKE